MTTTQVSWTASNPPALEWLSYAATLPGKTLNVALALCWYAEQRQSLDVRLMQSVLRQFAVSREASYDALRHLEQAGLIQVFRRTGRSPEVTLLKYQSPSR